MSENQKKSLDQEIHSEKMRELISNTPKLISIVGNVVIFTITVAILTVVYFVPYPYSEGESILCHIISIFISILQ